MIASISGGTDIRSARAGSCLGLPVYAGDVQRAALGAAVAAYDDQGRPALDQVGELSSKSRSCRRTGLTRPGLSDLDQ